MPAQLRAGPWDRGIVSFGHGGGVAAPTILTTNLFVCSRPDPRLCPRIMGLKVLFIFIKSIIERINGLIRLKVNLITSKSLNHLSHLKD